MLNVNNISTQRTDVSFKGRRHNSVVSNPIAESAPASPATKAAPSGLVKLPPTEYLNKNDLKRYQKVQKQWAEKVAKQLKIPTENVMARLPEIKLGDAKTMMDMNFLAGFSSDSNVIMLNPIRELANVQGGDEAKIVHESLHAYLHNLRRAYGKTISQEQASRISQNVVLKKMLDGEHGYICKGVKSVNGQQVSEFMLATELSQNERKALVDTIRLIKNEHMDPKTYKLNDEGKKIIREVLSPQLQDYKQIIDIPIAIEEEMISYVDASLHRSNLVASFISDSKVDLDQSLNLPLHNSEIKLARKSIPGLLSTQEGAIIRSSAELSQFSDQPLKMYFMSYEEKFARNQENLHRLNVVTQKIENIKAKGLTAGNVLLKEQETVKINLKLLKLADKFAHIEQQIISAPKNIAKLKDIFDSRVQIAKIICDSEYIETQSKLNFAQISQDAGSGKTLNEIIATQKENFPIEKPSMVDKYFEDNSKVQGLLIKINESNTPDKLLAETTENQALKVQFDRVLGKIRKLAPESDLTGMPKQFFESEAAYTDSIKEISHIFCKWAKRLKV